MTKKRNWFWGVFFILAAVLLIVLPIIGVQTVGFWSLLACVLLAAIIIQSILYRVWVGLFIPLALIYLLLRGPLGWPAISPWALMGAAVLLSIGFHLLFRLRPRKWPHHPHHRHDAAAVEVDENEDDEYPVMRVRFGAAVRYLRTDKLRGGEFYSEFGAMEVYMDQAQLSDAGAEVFVDVHFGALKLYVPRNWPIDQQLQTGWGTLDMKNKEDWAPDNSLPTLLLRGNIHMGAVEVRFI